MKPDMGSQSLAHKLAATMRFVDWAFYVGLALVLALVLFGYLGRFFVDPADIRMRASSLSTNTLIAIILAIFA